MTMAPRKQTYEERLKRFFDVTTKRALEEWSKHLLDANVEQAPEEESDWFVEPWITRNEVILRFGPDYAEALAEVERLLDAGTIIRMGYRGTRGPMSWKYRWIGVMEI
jgi:hypothetical protein